MLSGGIFLLLLGAVWLLAAPHAKWGDAPADTRFVPLFLVALGMVFLASWLATRTPESAWNRRWISTRRICGVTFPGGKRKTLAAEACQLAVPVLRPLPRSRADLLLFGDSPSLADIAAAPSPRRHAAGLWSLTSADASSALAALSLLRSDLPPAPPAP